MRSAGEEIEATSSLAGGVDAKSVAVVGAEVGPALARLVVDQQRGEPGVVGVLAVADGVEVAVAVVVAFAVEEIVVPVVAEADSSLQPEPDAHTFAPAR